MTDRKHPTTMSNTTNYTQKPNSPKSTNSSYPKYKRNIGDLNNPPTPPGKNKKRTTKEELQERDYQSQSTDHGSHFKSQSTDYRSPPSPKMEVGNKGRSVPTTYNHYESPEKTNTPHHQNSQYRSETWDQGTQTRNNHTNRNNFENKSEISLNRNPQNYNISQNPKYSQNNSEISLNRNPQNYNISQNPKYSQNNSEISLNRNPQNNNISQNRIKSEQNPVEENFQNYRNKSEQNPREARNKSEQIPWEGRNKSEQNPVEENFRNPRNKSELNPREEILRYPQSTINYRNQNSNSSQSLPQPEKKNNYKKDIYGDGGGRGRGRGGYSGGRGRSDGGDGRGRGGDGGGGGRSDAGYRGRGRGGGGDGGDGGGRGRDRTSRGGRYGKTDQRPNSVEKNETPGRNGNTIKTGDVVPSIDLTQSPERLPTPPLSPSDDNADYLLALKLQQEEDLQLQQSDALTAARLEESNYRRYPFFPRNNRRWGVSDPLDLRTPHDIENEDEELALKLHEQLSPINLKPRVYYNNNNYNSDHDSDHDYDHGLFRNRNFLLDNNDSYTYLEPYHDRNHDYENSYTNLDGNNNHNRDCDDPNRDHDDPNRDRDDPNRDHDDPNRDRDTYRYMNHIRDPYHNRFRRHNFEEELYRLVGAVSPVPPSVHLLGVGLGQQQNIFDTPYHLSYESLTQLEDVKVGVDQVFLEAMPVFTYTHQNLPDKECSICMENFSIGEELRRLSCFHCFHMICIDPWLSQSKRCPVCNVDITSI